MFSPETYAMLIGKINKGTKNKATKYTRELSSLMKSYLETGFNDAKSNSIFEVTAASSAWGYGFIGYKRNASEECWGIMMFSGLDYGAVYFVNRSVDGNWSAYYVK